MGGASAYAHVCSRMLTYAGISVGAKKGGDSGGGSALALLDEEEVHSIPVFKLSDDVCSRMLTYAHVCSRMQVDAIPVFKLSDDEGKKKKKKKKKGASSDEVPAC